MTGAAGDADSLVQRAIDSVLEQIPDLGDPVSPENSAKYQPWAEKFAPASKNKRPLDELLAEYAARIAATPGAVAGTPSAKHPVAAFFDRFGQPRGKTTGTRRRGRGGRGGGQSAPAAPPPQQQKQQQPQPQPQRRQRQQRPAEAVAAQPPPAAAEGKSAAARRRRRRPSGRRGRGGGGGGEGASPGPPRAAVQRTVQSASAWLVAELGHLVEDLGARVRGEVEGVGDPLEQRRGGSVQPEFRSWRSATA